MPKNSISYPNVCKKSDGRYFIDFALNDRRYRLFSGRMIHSSLRPNTYPKKLRFGKAILLAKEVYDFLVKNNYSFEKKISSLEFFDKIIDKKLQEPLSDRYKKELKSLSDKLRKQLAFKGEISLDYLDSIPLRYNNNTSYNTIRRYLNVLVNYLYENNFPIEKSKLKSRKQEETLHKPIEDVKTEWHNWLKMASRTGVFFLLTHHSFGKIYPVASRTILEPRVDIFRTGLDAQNSIVKKINP